MMMNDINVSFLDVLNLWGTEYLFRDIQLPPNVDKEITINTIIEICGICETIYTDKDLLKSMIDLFFKKNYKVFLKLDDAFNENYKATENYDRYEDILENSDSTSKNKTSSKDDVESVDMNDVSSFSNPIYQPSSKDSSISSNNSTSNYDGSSNSNSTTKIHSHGNIGVTTNQSMLKQELEIRKKLNIYNVIAEMFFNDFVLMC